MTEENKTTDAPVPGSPDYPLHSELTIGAYLKQQVAIDPDHEFVVYPDRDLRWTYKDFDERTDALAKGLLAIGMKPGDHLGVWARNIPDWLTFMYASAKIGVVMVTVNPVYKSHELDYVLKQSDMKALCVIDAYRDVDYLQIIRDLVPESLNVQRGFLHSEAYPFLENLIYMGPEKHRGFYSVPELLLLGQHKPDSSLEWAQGQFDNNDVVMMQYTSGTTGFPKGVMLTDNCFNALAQQFRAYDKLFHRGQKLMNIMPPFIAYGYACGVHLPLVLGLTVVIIPNLDPAKLGSLIWKYKPEHMFGVPAHYQQMAADSKLKDKDLSFIRNYAAGGDAISIGAEKTVNEFLAAHNVEYPMAKGYGMTEVSSAATCAAGKNNKLGSVGIPLVNTLVSVFEPDTEKELPIGERGELCISGPTMMKCYYNKPAETAAILRTHEDGRVWVHTGDIGYMDEDGFVYLDSRIKRLIIRHDGFKVFPSMIENVISQHPAVHQCSVVGCTDKDHVQGRLPFVYIVLDPEAAVSVKKRQVVKELRQLCAEELPEYVQPVGYKFIDSMPMTPVGKFDYRKLEEEITSRDY